MSINAKVLELFTKDSEGTRFAKIIGKKDGNITVTTSTDNELGLAEITFKAEGELAKAKVGETFSVIEENGKQTISIKAAEPAGKTGKSSTPRGFSQAEY